MIDEVRKSEVPDEPLGHLAKSMTDLVPDGTHAIVMLRDEDDRAMLHLSGFETEGDAITEIVVHLKAIFEANGQDLVIVPMFRGRN